MLINDNWVIWFFIFESFIMREIEKVVYSDILGFMWSFYFVFK